MTCLKTGAVVFLPEYNTKVVCDLYKVGNAIVINFDPNCMYTSTSHRPTHEVYIGSDYMSKGKGVIVVHADQFKHL